jgi:hypothetical protein
VRRARGTKSAKLALSVYPDFPLIILNITTTLSTLHQIHPLLYDCKQIGEAILVILMSTGLNLVGAVEMNFTDTPAAIDQYEEQLIQMATTTTYEDMLAWLHHEGVEVSRRTLARRLVLWNAQKQVINEAAIEQLTRAVNHLFYTQPTYTDTQIVKRLQEDHDI